MNTSQEANTSLSTEVCHCYWSKMELAVCIQCVHREPNGFATKRKWKINLYLRVTPNFIGFGHGHELLTGIWTWKSEQKLTSSDWKMGATKIENTLHRCLSKWLAENTWNSVSLRKQRVPQGDVHISKTKASTHDWEMHVPAGVQCYRVLAMKFGFWQVQGRCAHSSVFKMTQCTMWKFSSVKSVLIML